jgi:hypothetical protein
MGILEILFGKKTSSNCDVRPDKVWLSNEAKFAGPTVAGLYEAGRTANTLSNAAEVIADC